MTQAQTEHKKLVELALIKIMEIHVLISDSQDLQAQYPENWAMAGDMGRILAKLGEAVNEE